MRSRRSLIRTVLVPWRSNPGLECFHGQGEPLRAASVRGEVRGRATGGHLAALASSTVQSWLRHLWRLFSLKVWALKSPLASHTVPGRRCVAALELETFGATRIRAALQRVYFENRSTSCYRPLATITISSSLSFVKSNTTKTTASVH